MISNFFRNFYAIRNSFENWYAKCFLFKKTTNHIWWNLIFNTRHNYEIAMNNYKRHCSMKLIALNFWSINEWILHHWMIFMSISRLKFKIIKTYIDALKSAHIDRDYSNFSIFNSSLLQRHIREIKRKYQEDDRRERKFITRDILLKLLAKFDINIKWNVTMHVVFCLTFANFLRVKKFTYKTNEQNEFDFVQWHVTRFFVVLQIDFLKLILFFFKMNLFRHDVIIIIATTSDASCFVNFLRHFFIKYSATANTSLFEIELYKFFNTQMITNVLRKKFCIVKKREHYSKHSFRRKIVTEIRIQNVIEIMIQMLNRWSFNAYLLYIDVNKTIKLIIFRFFQIFRIRWTHVVLFATIFVARRCFEIWKLIDDIIVQQNFCCECFLHKRCSLIESIIKIFIQKFSKTLIRFAEQKCWCKKNAWKFNRQKKCSNFLLVILQTIVHCFSFSVSHFSKRFCFSLIRFWEVVSCTYHFIARSR